MDSRLIKILIIVSICILPSISNAKPKPDFVSVDPVPETTSIYIKTESDIDNLDTVTYYLTNNAVDKVLLDSFFIFSEKIDEHNGAVILPLTESVRNKIKNEGITQNNIFLIRAKSSCDFSYSKKDFLIFEDRVSNECLYFITEDDMAWLIEALGTIYQNTHNIEHQKDTSQIQKKSIENLLTNGVNIDSGIVNNENKSLIVKFIDYLSKKIEEKLSKNS